MRILTNRIFSCCFLLGYNRQLLTHFSFSWLWLPHAFPWTTVEGARLAMPCPSPTLWLKVSEGKHQYVELWTEGKEVWKTGYRKIGYNLVCWLFKICPGRGVRPTWVQQEEESDWNPNQIFLQVGEVMFSKEGRKVYKWKQARADQGGEVVRPLVEKTREEKARQRSWQRSIIWFDFTREFTRISTKARDMLIWTVNTFHWTAGPVFLAGEAETLLF